MKYTVTAPTYTTPMHNLPCFQNLLVLILIQKELSGLPRWVNDQGIAVEPFHHDGILHTEVISGESVAPPGQSFVCRRQVLDDQGEIHTYICTLEEVCKV